jgi:hypothetical protein
MDFCIRGDVDLGSESDYGDEQIYNAEMESPNDMIMDQDEYVTEQPENEKDEDDVALINPDQLGSDVDLLEKPRADDCMSSAIFWASNFMC